MTTEVRYRNILTIESSQMSAMAAKVVRWAYGMDTGHLTKLWNRPRPSRNTLSTPVQRRSEKDKNQHLTNLEIYFKVSHV